MTRRDFELIAKVIDNAGGLSDADALYIAEMFADELAKTNPRFNREKFLKACGVEVSSG